MMQSKNNRVHRLVRITLLLVFTAAFLFTCRQTTYAASKKGTVEKVEVTNLPAKVLTLKKGKTFTLKTKVTVKGKADKKVLYKSSAPGVVSVSAKGKLKAVGKKGSAKITVYAKANTKKKVVIKVKIGTPVKKVVLDNTSASIETGKTLKLTATVSPKKPTNKKIIWTSSDTGIASVSGDGVVTGIKAGTATITATAQDGSGKKAKAAITVTEPKKETLPDPTPETEKPDDPKPETEKPNDPTPETEKPDDPKPETEEPITEEPVTEEPATEEPATEEPVTEEPETETIIPVTEVTLNKTEAFLLPEETLELTATVLPEDATDKNVTWTSSDTSVATVSEGVVTAAASGTAAITAEAGGKSAVCTINVLSGLKISNVTGDGIGDFVANDWGDDDLTIYYDKKAQQEVPKEFDVTYTNESVQHVTVEEELDENGDPGYYFIAAYKTWTLKYSVRYNDVRDCIAVSTADENDSLRVDGDRIYVWTDKVFAYPQLTAKTTFEDREKDLLCEIDSTHWIDDEGAELYGTVKVTIGDCRIEYGLLLYYHAVDENENEIPLYDVFDFASFSGDGLLFARCWDGYYEEYGAGHLAVYYGILEHSEPRNITAYRSDGEKMTTTGQYSEKENCYFLRVEYGIWHYVLYVSYDDIFSEIGIWTGDDHLMDYSYENDSPYMSIKTVDGLPEIWVKEGAAGVQVQSTLSLVDDLDENYRTLGVLTLSYGEFTRKVVVSLNYDPDIHELLGPTYITGEGVISDTSKSDWYDCHGQIELDLVSEDVPATLTLTLPDGSSQEVDIFTDDGDEEDHLVVLIRKGIWTEPYYVTYEVIDPGMLSAAFISDEDYGSDVSETNGAYEEIEEVFCDEDFGELIEDTVGITADEAAEEPEDQDVPEELEEDFFWIDEEMFDE